MQSSLVPWLPFPVPMRTPLWDGFVNLLRSTMKEWRMSQKTLYQPTFIHLLRSTVKDWRMSQKTLYQPTFIHLQQTGEVECAIPDMRNGGRNGVYI